jgi:farnesyl diphosphate synthase
MHYAVLNGGKRLRPLLVYATGHALQTSLENLDLPAIAVELIHCYSLVHDDLPAMDNDDWRRGQPTCHKKFNEATAILVGDALQSLAFNCLNNIEMVNTLAKASGSYGMAGGQDLDLESEDQMTNLSELEHMHRLKTGALIEASVELGIIAAKCNDSSIKASLKKFSQNIGLAFQIRDDILDVEGNTQGLGKTAGIDTANNKATYTTILGVSEAKDRLQKHYEIAMNSLNELSFDTSNLKQLCTYVVNRKN